MMKFRRQFIGVIGALAAAALLTIVPTTFAQDATAEPTIEVTPDATVEASAEAPAVIAQTPTQICEGAVPATEPDNRTFTSVPVVLAAGIDYSAVFCTEAGAVYINLFEDLTPVTVNNFVFLAQQGYYNNTTFHRVIQDFMVQGGDPTATGSGGPGYQFQDEFVGFLTFDAPGLLAMANAGPGTNGSQFFITTVPTEHLNYRHTIFGQVLEGQENVTAVRLRDPQTDPAPGTALQTVVIVTDPASVQSARPASVVVTSAEVEAKINEIGAQLPASLVLDTEVTGISTADTVIASAAPDVQERYRTLLSDNGFDFRAAVEVDNVACDLSATPFYSVSYTLDAFATPGNASAVIADGLLSELPRAAGYIELNADTTLPNPVYIGVETVCDVQATKAITYWQRGRFVITAEAVYPENSPQTADVWLSEIVGVRIFERIFTPILRTTLN